MHREGVQYKKVSEIIQRSRKIYQHHLIPTNCPIQNASTYHSTSAVTGVEDFKLSDVVIITTYLKDTNKAVLFHSPVDPW